MKEKNREGNVNYKKRQRDKPDCGWIYLGCVHVDHGKISSCEQLPCHGQTCPGHRFNIFDIDQHDIFG